MPGRVRSFLFPCSLAVVAVSFLLTAAALPAIRLHSLGLGSAALILFILVPVALRRLGWPLDGILYPLLVALAGLGLSQMVRLQAAGLGPLGERQSLWLLCGLGFFLLGTRAGRSCDLFCQYRYVILLFALVLLSLTIPFGVEVGGSRAWLRLGWFQMQPSEIARPLVLFFLASYLGQHQPLLRAERSGPVWRHRWLLGPALCMWAFSLAVLLFQHDLGTAVLYYASFLILLYLASGRFRHLAGGVGLGALGVLAALLREPHVRTRFYIWLHPLARADGIGFQAARSLFALGSGGLLGTGPGFGLPEATPAVHTDLIFSAIGEELGLAGALAVLLLWFLLVARSLFLAGGAGDRVGYLYGAALAFSLGLQALLIAGGTIGLLPLTGVTLPLLSYGGSSLVATLFSLGIINGLGAGRGRESLAG